MWQFFAFVLCFLLYSHSDIMISSFEYDFAFYYTILTQKSLHLRIIFKIIHMKIALQPCEFLYVRNTIKHLRHSCIAPPQIVLSAQFGAIHFDSFQPHQTLFKTDTRTNCPSADGAISLRSLMFAPHCRRTEFVPARTQCFHPTTQLSCDTALPPEDRG